MGKKQEEASSRTCSIGDYVLATKWRDGDPKDQWAVGFLQEIEVKSSGNVRYHIADSAGNLFRGNGFRRIAKITPEFGDWLVKNSRDIDLGSASLWKLKRIYRNSHSGN